MNFSPITGPARIVRILDFIDRKDLVSLRCIGQASNSSVYGGASATTAGETAIPATAVCSDAKYGKFTVAPYNAASVEAGIQFSDETTLFEAGKDYWMFWAGDMSEFATKNIVFGWTQRFSADTTPGAALGVDGCGVRRLTTATVFTLFSTQDGGSTFDTKDTNATLDTSYHTYSLHLTVDQYNANAGTLDFYVDGALKGSMETTKVPNTEVTQSLVYSQQGTAAAGTFTVDYFGLDDQRI